MENLFNIDERIIKASKEAMLLCQEELKKIDEIQEYNQQKVLYAFQKAKISESHFTSSTGYGYDDRGREALEEVYATIFNGEDALVRHNFVSGTHTLSTMLFGILRPNDKMVSITGTPYDTLHGVIGIDENKENINRGTLIDFGVNYSEIPLSKDGRIDKENVMLSLDDNTKMAYIQRSRGYSVRPSFTVQEVIEVAKMIKEKFPNCIIAVDNCYCEFTQKEGILDGNYVDIIAGSLIKNAGGGIASTGGYIVGRKHLIHLCACRLTTPTTHKEVGATLGQNREMFMGTFSAPHVTGEALKTAVFASALFEILGYEVSPKYNEERADIVQLLMLENSNSLIAFCKGIQMAAPIDSFVVPEPWEMPGYDSKVIMAAGAFTLGSSIELSADAPLREPFAVWLQGGLNFHSGKLGVMLATNSMYSANLLKIHKI